MSESRGDMLVSLKRVLIPELRARGFRGSVPHFRRTRPVQVDLLTIQFSRWGGEFVIELARAPGEGLTTHAGEFVPPGKLTAHHVLARHRLGAARPGDDYWFKFDQAGGPEGFERVAEQVLPLLDTQAESYWRDA